MVAWQISKVHSELRSKLLVGLLVLIGVAGFVLALTSVQHLPPPSQSAWGVALIAFALVTYFCWRRFPEAAMAILGPTLVALITLGRFWVPTIGIEPALLLAVLAASMVRSLGHTILTTLLAMASLALIPGQGLALQHLWTLRTDVICLAILAAALSLNHDVHDTLVSWAWQGYTDAQRHLDTARNRQVELKQALDDLALVNREVTRLNDMLLSSRQAVEDARLAKEAFVANVSHELRTPLNMIIGFSNEILQRPGIYAIQLPQQLLADVSAIHRNSRHLAGLVDDILDLAESESGHMRLIYERTSIQQIVAEAIEQVGLLFEKKGLYLVSRVDSDIPAVECDHERLRQVVLNVLSNAGRYTQSGGATVHARESEGMVTVSISDTGPGISSDKMRRLFEPFQQADPSMRRKHGGTGLGLSISKRLIEMHGGEIWMESRVGEGTTVTFTLPLIPPSTPDPTRRYFGPYGEPIARVDSSRAPVQQLKPRLAMVDRDQRWCQMLNHHFSAVSTVAVASLQEARDLVDAGNAQAVLVNSAYEPRAEADWRDMGTRFDVPILSCWLPSLGYAEDDMDIIDYMTKPIMSEPLCEAVQDTLPEGGSVLIADDDDDARLLFRRMIEGLGPDYAVTTVQDGVETLAALRRDRPGLLLLDLGIPRKDGFQVLQEKAVDESIADVPVILITARDPDREPALARELAVTRPLGLSRGEVARGIEALMETMTPRFGARAPRETPDP